MYFHRSVDVQVDDPSAFSAGVLVTENDNFLNIIFFSRQKMFTRLG